MLDKKCVILLLLCSLNWNTSFAQQIDDRPAVSVTATTTILIDSAESGPIIRAVQDLVRDLNKVFGTAPKVIHTLAEVNKNVPLIVVSCKGISTLPFRTSKINEFESHLITTTNANGIKAVVLQGADMRGTIYAIYSFSEKYLEIPPLWIWASYEPIKKAKILIPEKTYLYFPSPSVKWRAWFPNDKDLLSPWQAKNAENYDAIFETMLRLKLNTREGYLIDLGGWNTPYTASKEALYVRDRGLKISFTHTAPFGATFTNWERYWTTTRHLKKAPPLLLKNVDALKEFWTYHIETIKRAKLDVIWQIGFRGLGDKPFWRKTFVDAVDEPTEDKDRAAIINSMLALQIALLKKETGEANPLMKLTIYNEASDFLAKGLLNLPDEPNLILNYANVRGDHYPPEEMQNFDQKLAQKPIGYYLNFQFTGTGSHLVPGEGPWKMEQSYRYIAQKIKKPVAFSVVNTGNVREHCLELSANAAMMWNYASYQTDAFLKSYCETYYGKMHADEIAKLYKDYYYAFWLPRKSDIPGFDRQYVFQDLRYAKGLTQLITLWDWPYLANPFNDKNKGIGGAMATDGKQFSIVPADNNAKNQVDAAIIGTQNSAKNFELVLSKADALYQKLPVKEKLFFNDELRIPVQFMKEANTAFYNLVEGYRDKQLGKGTAAKMHVLSAFESIRLLKGIKAKSNHDRFSAWSVPEKNFGIDSIQNNLSNLLKKLN
ncbi:glycosyl hydrolase 115 family protein [Pedobacter sp. Du54]|uniref:glycosyl hydrolase 115 family protein n=1 Tax=Pedobacter anseongensis TaxID=3133439 RepID=UPI0030B5B3D8